MTDETIEEEIVKTATEIGLPTSYVDIFDAQLSYWLSVHSLMHTRGYEAVKKRFPNVSNEVATALAAAQVRTIRLLCSAEICTLRPSVPDNTILAMLAPKPVEDIKARMVLQLMNDNKMPMESLSHV